jgi:hypothetical protein
MENMKTYLPVIVILLGVLQPLSGALAPALGIGAPIGNATREMTLPEQPLPAFFSIWSVIFFAYLLFGISYWRAREPWMERIAAPLAWAGAFNIIWMISAQLIASQPLDFLLLFPIAIAAWTAAFRMDRLRETGWSPKKALADLTAAMLSGWITVAIAISVPLTLRSFSGLGATDFPWQMLWVTLVTASLPAWMFARYISRSWWYFIALGWGMIGIVLNNWYLTEMNWLAIISAGVLTLIICLRLFRGADGSVIPA